MVLLPLNSCEVPEAPSPSGSAAHSRRSITCRGGGGGLWRSGNWKVTMALRVLMLVTLLLLADAQKWPPSGDCQPCECSYRTTSFGKMRTVNCSGRGLTSIPPNLPSDLMALDLSWNLLDVQQLRQRICSFPSLQLVSLAFANLTDLSDLLKECSSVQELNLSGNLLQQVDSATFVGLGNLRRLLGLEMKSVMARDIFKHLVNLKDLDVIFHGSLLPKGLFDDLGIQTLNLVLTQAPSLPQRVFEFGQRTLNTLYLRGERVQELGEGLLDGLMVLKKLYLFTPSLTELPERFFNSQKQPQAGEGPRKVANLQEVEIKGVRKLPAMLFNSLNTLETLQLKEIGIFPEMGILEGAINLRTLLVTGSQLRSVPDTWFRQLYSLETLTLSGLELEEVGENAFTQLFRLTYLDLSENRLGPGSMTANMLKPLSKSLETLILRGNLLTSLDKDVLGDLGTLRYLDVSENRLTNIHTNTFTAMTFLSSLYLNSNRLTSLPQDVFGGLLQVQGLSLSENYLVDFPKAILRLDGSLMSLDLAFNELRTVPALALCGFMYLERVSITGNKLYCDCSLLAFLQCPRVQVEGQCKSPPKFKGMDITNIVVDEVLDFCAEESKAEDSNLTLQTITTLATSTSASTTGTSTTSTTTTTASTTTSSSTKTTKMPLQSSELQENSHQKSGSTSSTVESSQKVTDAQSTHTLTIVRDLFPESLTNQSKNENGAQLYENQAATAGSSESVMTQSSGPADEDPNGLKNEIPHESDGDTAQIPTQSDKETTDSHVQSTNDSQQASGENYDNTQTPTEHIFREDLESSKAANKVSSPNLNEQYPESSNRPLPPLQDKRGKSGPSEEAGEGAEESQHQEKDPDLVTTTMNTDTGETFDYGTKVNGSLPGMFFGDTLDMADLNYSYADLNNEDEGTDKEENSKATFNFIISAVVSLSLSGMVVLGVIFVRRWQKKGSYRLNEVAELDSIQREADEAFYGAQAILADKAKEEVV